MDAIARTQSVINHHATGFCSRRCASLVVRIVNLDWDAFSVQINILPVIAMIVSRVINCGIFMRDFVFTGDAFMFMARAETWWTIHSQFCTDALLGTAYNLAILTLNGVRCTAFLY